MMGKYFLIISYIPPRFSFWFYFEAPKNKLSIDRMLSILKTMPAHLKSREEIKRWLKMGGIGILLTSYP